MNRIPVRRDGPPPGMTYKPPAPKTESAEAYRERHLLYGRKAWLNARAAALRVNPLCERCKAQGTIEPATQVHHRVDLKDAPELAYDLANLESLCRVCHSKETAGRMGWRGRHG
jgi:5-methylcytosine-specific restriction endonuclease McrA